MPSSSRTSSVPSSRPRSNREYSLCSEAIGAVAAARRMSRRLRLRQPDEPHLPRADELRHRPDRLLDRRVGIDAMALVQVDHVDAEPLEARIARPADVVGAPVEGPYGRIVGPDDAELRRDDGLVAPARERPADELLVRPAPVHVGRVEQGHAELESAVNRPDRLGFVRTSVELGHPHAAEPDRRDGPGRCDSARAAPWPEAIRGSSRDPRSLAPAVSPSGSTCRSRPGCPGSSRPAARAPSTARRRPERW